jgi:RNA polymerase sigma factor (sigma-70 family)
VLSAVYRLPPRQREVLVLRYYADLSERQIADALDISPGSVKAHAHRAITSLRSTLGGAS